MSTLLFFTTPLIKSFSLSLSLSLSLSVSLLPFPPSMRLPSVQLDVNLPL